MNILVVGLVTSPQVKRLQKEGEKRGHQVDGCYSADLVIKASPEQFEVVLKEKKITDYNLIYLWAFAKRRWEWSVAAWYLHRRYQMIIVNQKIIDPTYPYSLDLTPAIDYFKQTENGINYPRSTVVFSAAQLDELITDFHFPLILKVSTSKQGRGVYKVNSFQELQWQMDKLEKQVKSQQASFIIREFIPNDGDIRVFTVGYKAIGAMKRTPKPGDFRSNISQGGTGSPFDLEKAPKVRQMAEKISRLTRTEIAGVDIMLHKKTGQPYLLEVNAGPQFTGLEKYTQTNAALAIIKYFERLAVSSGEQKA